MTNPEYMEIEKIFITNIKKIEIIDIIKIDEETNIDNLMYRYYGNGVSDVNGIDGVLKYLPLLLLFNNLPDITNIKSTIIIKIPDLESFFENIYTLEIFDDNLSNNIPGVYSFTNNTGQIKKIDSSTISKNKNTTGIPKLNITLPKVKIDYLSGKVTF